MFDHDPKSLAATLSRMERLSREKTQFNQTEARGLMSQWVSQDRRFDGYDAPKLVERVAHCKSYGAALDLDDPELRKGGSKRPLDRSQY
jgi:hypothetical protein